MRVVGLDPSTKTGFAVMDSDTSALLDSGSYSVAKLTRFARWSGLRFWVKALLTTYEPGLVVIEGYGYANAHSLALLVELGTVLRSAILDANVRMVEIPPNSLKKFVTGKGIAPKNVMLKEIMKLWAFDTDDDDEADAYGLAQFGVAIATNCKLVTKARAAVVSPYIDKLLVYNAA